MNRNQRATVHAALGDEIRLTLVDALAESDLSVQELRSLVGLPGNLLAHHLNVLDEAGLIERRMSEGDRRRRYVVLHRGMLAGLMPVAVTTPPMVLFVCSHNSARSQYAAARWRQKTGLVAESAGHDPASEVNPTAVRVAAEFGLDLSQEKPRGYDAVTKEPDLLVSVCDRARESDLPAATKHIHWSIPDPVTSGRVSSFRAAFTQIDARVEDLAGNAGS